MTFTSALEGCFFVKWTIVTRLHLRKDYMAETTEGSFVRGRIL